MYKKNARIFIVIVVILNKNTHTEIKEWAYYKKGGREKIKELVCKFRSEWMDG